MNGRTFLDKQQFVSRRTAKRYRMSGVVVLEKGGEPMVSIIHDFSTNGVSFLNSFYRYTEDTKFLMDILIYDFKSSGEYLVNGLNGLVQSTDLVTDEVSKGLIWRTRVAFQKLDVPQQERLANLPWTDFAMSGESGW